MTIKVALRRSVLYVPGDRSEMLQRAGQRGADALILNLEDAVAPANKNLARDTVANALRTADFGSAEVIVRINRLDSATGYCDLLAVVQAALHAVLLPKVSGPEEVRFAAWTLERLEDIHDMPTGQIGVMCMIESAAGVLGANEIARCHPRVSALIFGAADYTENVGCSLTVDRRTLIHPMSLVVLAARAAGITAIDAPCMRPSDLECLRVEAQQARELGFDGKSAIHPSQVSIIHDILAYA